MFNDNLDDKENYDHPPEYDAELDEDDMVFKKLEEMMKRNRVSKEKKVSQIKENPNAEHAVANANEDVLRRIQLLDDKLQKLIDDRNDDYEIENRLINFNEYCLKSNIVVLLKLPEGPVDATFENCSKKGSIEVKELTLEGMFPDPHRYAAMMSKRDDLAIEIVEKFSHILDCGMIYGSDGSPNFKSYVHVSMHLGWVFRRTLNFSYLLKHGIKSELDNVEYITLEFGDFEKRSKLELENLKIVHSNIDAWSPTYNCKIQLDNKVVNKKLNILHNKLKSYH
jgi:hypothetical protein